MDCQLSARYLVMVMNHVLMVMSHELMVISHVHMLINNVFVCLFTYPNVISLQGRVRELPEIMMSNWVKSGQRVDVIFRNILRGF